MRRELTPTQDYLKRVYMALEGQDKVRLFAVLMERLTTLKSAISAAFYKSNGFDIKRYI